MHANRWLPKGIPNEKNENVELTANKYTLHCMTVAMIILLIIWILNMFNIFMMDHKPTTIATILFFIMYSIGRIIFQFQDLSRPCMKYFIISWSIALITILTTTFTFHAIFGCLLPVMFTAMYPSKKLMYFTYALMVMSITITVYGGYYWGICDANMVLLTGKTFENYILPDNTFALTKINDNVSWTLFLFFVVPRCMICIVLILVSRSISKIISANVTYAHKMAQLAEVDQMTGLFNRSKYLSMIDNDYRNENQLAVIFWDINYLKQVNDSLGHEAGDELIITIANIIQKLTTTTDKAYRIGGDEFVMVLCGADEAIVQKKVKEWERQLSQASTLSELPLSASIGYGIGNGENLDYVINMADKMMYENKRIYHQKKLDKKE